MLNPAVGYQPRNTPAERRAFFDQVRLNASADDRIAALEAQVADLEARVTALEGP